MLLFFVLAYSDKCVDVRNDTTELFSIILVDHHESFLVLDLSLESEKNVALAVVNSLSLRKDFV